MMRTRVDSSPSVEEFPDPRSTFAPEVKYSAVNANSACTDNVEGDCCTMDNVETMMLSRSYQAPATGLLSASISF